MKIKKNPLVEALRDELKSLIEGDLNITSLMQIANIAGRAQALLLALSSPSATNARKSIQLVNDPMPMTGIGIYPPPMLGDSDGVLAASPVAETFGAKGMREIMETIGAYLRSQHETPEKLVSAIAAARSANLPEIAAKLEEKLLGKTTNGKAEKH